MVPPGRQGVVAACTVVLATRALGAVAEDGVRPDGRWLKDALAAGDECGADGGGACALEALQFRGRQVAARDTGAAISAEAASTEEGSEEVVGANTTMCRNLCWKNFGFWSGDCRCDVHSSWYMWICSKRHGVPIKAEFGHQHSCSGLTHASAASSSSASASCTEAYKYDCSATKKCCDPGKTCYRKNSGWAACLSSCSPGIHWQEPAAHRSPWSCERVSADPAPAPAPPPPAADVAPAPVPAPAAGEADAEGGDVEVNDSSAAAGPVETLVPRPADERTADYAPKDAALLQSSEASLFTFYVYRVQNEQEYRPENQNMANLAGALFYLHNEIVWHTPRRFGKTRLQKFKVQTRATTPLLAQGMNFGTRVAFDKGMCTGPYDCQKEWEKYGYYVGCNKVGSFPTGQWGHTCMYPNAVWYSFPGECPSMEFDKRTPECIEQQPGGACPEGVQPTGAGNCTYSYELVGDLSINDLSGIGDDYEAFVKTGGREYNKWTDRGTKTSFWDHKGSASACQARMDTVIKMFQAKYPAWTKDEALPEPPCDFNYGSFY